MALPEPVPGLVVSYDYLWHRELVAGRDEGAKSRPCAVVAAMRRSEGGLIRVLVVPITHRAPDEETVGVEIPAVVKARLGLDDASSYAILSEWNDFVWPGPDLRPVAGSRSFAYGVLPPRLFETLRRRFVDLARAGAAKRVARQD